MASLFPNFNRPGSKIQQSRGVLKKGINMKAEINKRVIRFVR
jgi:hypothetical protein